MKKNLNIVKKHDYCFLDGNEIFQIYKKVLSVFGEEKAEFVKNAINKEQVLFFSKQEKKVYVERLLKLNFDALCPMLIDSTISDKERKAVKKVVFCNEANVDCMKYKEECWIRFLRNGRLVFDNDKLIKDVLNNSKQK